MTKKVVIIVFIMLTVQVNASLLFGQEQKKKINKNVISFNVTRLVLLEARFGYERYLSERHVVRASVGIQFPINSESYSYLIKVPFYYAVTKGIYTGLGYNYVLNKHSKSYISGEVYYNYSYYNNKYYKGCHPEDKAKKIEYLSMNEWITGLKILFGKKINFSRNKDSKIQLDLFCGLGAQYRHHDETIYKELRGTCSIERLEEYGYENDPPETKLSHQLWPTLHGGILISFPF
jgi:hypothetical protein